MSTSSVAIDKTMGNSETAQKIDVVVHNFFCLLIDLLESLREESTSIRKRTDGAVKGEEN